MATPCYISCDMFFVRMVADATASRSPIKRSILSVCEHLADKLDAADAPLSQQINYTIPSTLPSSAKRIWLA